MNTHPSQEAIAEKIEELYLSDRYDAEFRKKLIVNTLTTYAQTIREEGEARERMRLARVMINASMLDEEEINEEDFNDVSKLDVFMAGVEHVHKAFREALTPTTNHTGENEVCKDCDVHENCSQHPLKD